MDKRTLFDRIDSLALKRAKQILGRKAPKQHVTIVRNAIVHGWINHEEIWVVRCADCGELERIAGRPVQTIIPS